MTIAKITRSSEWICKNGTVSSAQNDSKTSGPQTTKKFYFDTFLYINLEQERKSQHPSKICQYLFIT